MSNLITAFEVKRHSPAGKDYPEANICLLLPQIEEEVMRTCLGVEMYDWLKSKLTPYPANVGAYDPSVEYGLCEVVIRFGCLFKSKVACNRTDPAELDNDWEDVKKFTDTCANNLWERYLRTLLALRIYDAVITYDTIRSSSGGLIVHVNEGLGAGHRSATKSEIGDVSARLKQDAERTMRNMWVYLQALHDKKQCQQMPIQSAYACWAGAPGCENPPRAIRRIAFRV